MVVARHSPSTRMAPCGLQLRSFSARIGHHEPSTRYSISSASSHSLRIFERSLGRGGQLTTRLGVPRPPNSPALPSFWMPPGTSHFSLQQQLHRPDYRGPGALNSLPWPQAPAGAEPQAGHAHGTARGGGAKCTKPGPQLPTRAGDVGAAGVLPSLPLWAPPGVHACLCGDVTVYLCMCAHVCMDACVQVRT